MNAREIAGRARLQTSFRGDKKDLENLLGLTTDESLEEERSFATSRGVKKTRYHEKFKGLHVYDTVVTAGDDDSHDVTGHFVQAISDDLDDVTPTLTSQQAITIAKRSEGDDNGGKVCENEQARLYVYVDGDEIAR